MKKVTCPTWYQDAELLLIAAAGLEKLLRAKKANIGPTTSGGVIQVSKNRGRSPGTSQPERWVLQNSEEIAKVQKFLNLIGSIELTWLEAIILFHHYYRGVSLADAASVAGCHVRDAQSARDNLIRKVAARLGYI